MAARDVGKKAGTVSDGGSAGSLEVTRFLLAYGDGDRSAFDQMLPLVYSELRRIARRQLRRLRPGDTLDTTGLVHEAYVKLLGQQPATWNGRGHFFAIAARAMRQILVNYALHKQTLKRSSHQVDADIESAEAVSIGPEGQLLELNAALEKLELVDQRLPRVVECRFFAGMTEEETAVALNVSLRTVQRDWKLARGWLQEVLLEG